MSINDVCDVCGEPIEREDDSVISEGQVRVSLVAIGDDDVPTRYVDVCEYCAEHEVPVGKDVTDLLLATLQEAFLAKRRASREVT